MIKRLSSECRGWKAAVFVFPGRLRSGRPVVLVASPYLPFPLSHGGAVRIYNLMKQAAANYDQVLLAFVTEASVPAPELLELCAEIVLVPRPGSHARPLTERPDTGEEFDSDAYRAALHETLRKWKPFAVQLAIQHGEPAHFQKMQAIVDQMAAAIERGITGQESAELDIAFHTVIYQAARHKRLYDFWTELQPQVHILLLARTVANPDFRQSGVVADHQNILNAIQQQDEARATELVIQHLQSSYARIIQSYADGAEANGQPR